ncbi:CK1/CK1 protein kinase [Marasmius fiardii PR-910]|nr:CK1/CK1 protein kinase [Marasmius fiardii PR-910]
MPAESALSQAPISYSSSSDDESVIVPPPFPPILANFWLGEKLGAGYSGSIFKATHIHNGQVVALKVQHTSHENLTNRYERNFYPMIQGGVGMPTLWAAGVEGCWDYLAIDLLGSSLDGLYRKSGKDTMDLGSVCCIAMQVIERLEFMHSRGLLHRDIQLGNCVVGLPPNHRTIYMIDFGFSKRYIDPYTHRHIPDSKVKRDFIGNYWFSSVGVHCRGKVPSRRDDLEAVALMLIHLLTPRGLPWTRHGVPKTEEAHDMLKRQKQRARPEDLCRGIPSEFEEFLRYCRRLKFLDTPDYGKWIDEFRELAIAEGFSGSADFVWPPPVKKKLVHQPRKSQGPPPEELRRILDDLKKLDLGDRQVLADRSNVKEAVRNAKEDARAQKDNSTRTRTTGTSKAAKDGDEAEMDVTSVPPPFMTPKAYKLSKLTGQVLKATDNHALAAKVTEFVAVMKSNTSRTLTKDGFGFLDALYKQLAEPSVFITPMRTSRSKDTPTPNPDPHIKLGVVAQLRSEVTQARNNRRLAEMVRDFGNVTNRSTGRTVTKDGFAFLEGLARQLQVLA